MLRIITGCFIAVFFMNPQVQGQTTIEDDFKAEYNRRIQKSRIGDTYIPKDFDDAFIEIRRLSDPKDLKKFQVQEEEEVAKKLHFGLGKWMIRNWSFYEGSRYSHFLKLKDLHHPDDMAHVTIRLFHRHLNGKDLDADTLIKEISERRKAQYEREMEGKEVLDSFRRKKQ